MDKYFYLNSRNEQVGPVSPEEFSRLGINESSMVWKQGMANWMRAGQIPELIQYVRGGGTPPPPPPVGNGFGGNNGSNINLVGNNNGYNGVNGLSGVPPKIDNNMLWGILTTLFCCLPFGIYSIVLSSKVNSLCMSGDYAGAQAAADDAKKWAMIVAGCGLVAYVLCFLGGLLGG